MVSLSPTTSKTRMTRLPPNSNVEKASRTAASCETSDRSYCSSTPGGVSATASRRDVPSLRSAISFAPVAISVSFCTLRGNSACKPSITAPAAAAVFRRSRSHERRILATEGTKISTSAIITKITVSNSRRPESPRSIPACSAPDCLPCRQAVYAFRKHRALILYARRRFGGTARFICKHDNRT